MNVVRQLLADLARAGVKEWVVATGARNLVLVRELMQARDAWLWHGFEERSCGFFALGRIQGGAGPVAVVTTSGTAVAELLPAVIEAHYQGLPLVVVTADRPPHFRGSGAPQAIEQAGLLRPYCRLTADLTADGRNVSDDNPWTVPERLPWNSPTHINLCLEEPQAPTGFEDNWCLPPGDQPPTAAEHGSQSSDAEAERQVAAFLQRDRPTLVLVAGLNSDDERVAVADWLRRMQLPALWECTAGWGDPAVIVGEVSASGTQTPPGQPAQEALLKQVSVGQVLRIGSVPSWRWWRDLEQRTEVEVLSLSRSGHRGLARSAGCRGLAVDLAGMKYWNTEPATSPADLPDDPIAERLLEKCQRLPRAEPALLAALNRALDSRATVFIGNSLPIREWNLVSAGVSARRCHAARGANGIDGQVSHALGLVSHSEEGWLVIGDLTALYDLSGPSWIAQMTRNRPGIKIRIVVVNNGGGKIFSRMPAFAGLTAEQRKVTENLHQKSFAGWARLWGLEHQEFHTANEITLDRLRNLPDHMILELRPDESDTTRFWNNG